MIMMKETEVYGIDAQIIDAGCRQYPVTLTIPEVIRDGIKVLKLNGFSDEELNIDGEVIRSLLRNGSLLKVKSGFRIAMNLRP